MNDFGTGCASFNYLHRYLRRDQEYVCNGNALQGTCAGTACALRGAVLLAHGPTHPGSSGTGASVDCHIVTRAQRKDPHLRVLVTAGARRPALVRGTPCLVDLLFEHLHGVRAVSALLHFGQQGLSVEQPAGPHSEQQSAHLLFLARVARSMTGPPVDIVQRQFVQFPCVPVSKSLAKCLARGLGEGERLVTGTLSKGSEGVIRCANRPIGGPGGAGSHREEGRRGLWPRAGLRFRLSDAPQSPLLRPPVVRRQARAGHAYRRATGGGRTRPSVSDVLQSGVWIPVSVSL